jgi:non-specific serine/threonine protein kinase/serine/threonine-protein kinase
VSEPTQHPYATAQVANVFAAVREMEHPTRVGPYLIQSLIGQGGMGTVYKAEQREPIHRIVAVKIIKLGMDTREVIARFESERQALALMDHPNVAKVLDAGATDTGRPYFVMEYVAGEPITIFADRQKLSLRQRLELMVQACGAVQHAHQKALIHRDLKPSNILVALIDGEPHVKVIDFGVAKAISRRLTQKTLFTEAGQLVGTPEYMAPEQAEGTLLDVDTRADVYSLGVVLYELLCGALPFDPETLRTGRYDEISRMIRELDPPRPSVRLSRMSNELPSVAASRQVEPQRLGTLLRGELDWIVMKALEKDRTRRYQSPSTLAADLERHLSDRPVSAGPPSGFYRARKFVRRHKLAFGMAAALAMALGAGFVGTAWGFVNARRQRDAAVVARNQAVAARDEAVAARQAEAEAREYEKQTDRFLIEMFTAINPDKARGRDVSVREILDDAAKRIDTQPPAHKIVEAYLRSTFGVAYKSLGLLDKAEAQLRRSLELDRATDHTSQLRVANTLDQLGNICKDQGNVVEAESALRKALDLYRTAAGDDDPATISTETNLGVTLIAAGKFQEGETMLVDALARMRRARGIDPELRGIVASNLALLRKQQGRADEAEKMLREALADLRASEGPDHPATLGLMNNLANLLREQNRLPESLELLEASLQLSRKVNGPDHPDTLTMANNLALAYQAAGRLTDAEKLYLDTIERRSHALGADDPGTLLLRSNYGLLLQAMNRLDEAEAMFRDTLEHMRRAPDRNPADRITLESNIAWLLAQRGDYATAEAMYRKIIPEARQTFDPQSPAPLIFGGKLGHVLAQQQKWAEAESLLGAYYRFAQEHGVALNPNYLASYANCLTQLDKSSEALPVLEQADKAARAMPKPDPALLARISETSAIARAKAAQQERR